jgi:hypothetical protein
MPKAVIVARVSGVASKKALSVESFSDLLLLRRGELHALRLLPVAQRGIVEVEAVRHGKPPSEAKAGKAPPEQRRRRRASACPSRRAGALADLGAMLGARPD